MIHCWEDGDGSTCLLPDGHDGPHEFITDSDIVITFREEDDGLEQAER